LTTNIQDSPDPLHPLALRQLSFLGRLILEHWCYLIRVPPPLRVVSRRVTIFNSPQA